MNQKLFSISAALLVATLGSTQSSYGSEVSINDDIISEENVSDSSEMTVESLISESLPEASGTNSSGAETVKVGEYQSQTTPTTSPVAVIHEHIIDGRPAATIYVRDIPVLTLSSEEAIASSLQQPTENSQQIDDSGNSLADKSIKLPSSDDAQLEYSSLNGAASATTEVIASSSLSDSNESDSSTSFTDLESEGYHPTDHATLIAARINQLYQVGIESSEIIATWDDETETYVIKAGDTILIELDSDIVIPNSTGNMAEDVLQTTNLIRRQLGAEPITSIEGLPEPTQTRHVAVGPIRSTFTGRASWYGPGFHGRRSASGETFNQHAMTAAHRTLPFGTIVRVTNTANGASVTVRINDRGPFGGGRVLDLSAGAAQAIGMIQSGVATVRAEVLAP